MRCEDILRMLDEMRVESLPDPVRDHLASCSACSEAWSDWRMLRAGFRAIANDAPPEAHLGFASRVVRRLDNAADSGRAAAEFIERIGRRFVLASLILVMFLVLGLSLPASGPFRGSALDEPYLAQAEASPRADASPVGYESADSTPTSTTGGNQNPK